LRRYTDEDRGYCRLAAARRRALAGRRDPEGHAAGTTQQVTQKFSGVPADVTSAQQSSCQILLLDLGPIFLDLLGLQVDLSEITLDMTAVHGPGNLLCGLVGILVYSHRVTGAMEGLTECGSACFCDVKAAEERLTRSYADPLKYHTLTVAGLDQSLRRIVQKRPLTRSEG
jgi:hypothetical protein